MPVLRYYNLKEDVTIQCDASQRGLGVALLQGGQAVAYASRTVSYKEVNYAPIEKELLVIVFACEKSAQSVIQCGWPERKSGVPMCLRPYFDLHEELVVQGSAAPDELSMSYACIVVCIIKIRVT